MSKSVMMSEDNYTSELPKLLKGSGINFFGSISRNVLSFIFVVILTRFLSPSDVGIYYLGINIGTFITLLSLAGMDTGVRRFVSIYHGCNDSESMSGILSTSLRVAVPLSLVFGLSLFLLSDLIATNVFSKPQLSNVLKILSICAFLFSISELFLAATQGMKYMQYKVIAVDIVNNVVKIVVAVALFYTGLRLVGAVIAHVLAMAFVVGVAFYFFKKVFPFERQREVCLQFRRLLAFSLPQGISKICTNSTGMFETMILGYFLIAESVGVYSIALKVAMLGAVVLSSFNMMFAPIISDLHHRGRRDELKELYKTVTKWIFTGSFPLFLFMIFFSKNILGFFGPEFVVGSGCLIVLCMGQIVNSVTGPSGMMLLMSGHPYLDLISNILNVVLSIVLNLVLIPVYGIFGCAVAISVSWWVVNIIRVALVYRILKAQPYSASYLKPLCSGILSIMVFYVYFENKNVLNNVCGLGGALLCFLFLYGASLVLLRLDDSDMFVLQKMRQRLPFVN